MVAGSKQRSDLASVRRGVPQDVQLVDHGTLAIAESVNDIDCCG
jgi:hypothetical protein